MVPFIIIFLSFYGSLHLYGGLKLRQAFPLGAGAQLLLVVFLMAMVAAPLAIRRLERSAAQSAARTLALGGYVWMAFLMVFITVSASFDGYRLLAISAGWVTQSDLSDWIPSQRLTFMISLLAAASVTVYGYFEALNIRVEGVTIRSPKIPREIGRIRIAQISDVHLGLLVGVKRLRRILERVSALEADILVSTGDLVDGRMQDRETLAVMLRNIQTAYGKYAVTGNHEYYSGLEQGVRFTQQAGFRVLRGEADRIGAHLAIAGVDDATGTSPKGVGRTSMQGALAGVSPHRFTILLKHRPIVENPGGARFDLQLSGHTHKGQMFPFNLVTRISYPYLAGLFPLTSGGHLYVSRGTGTWGPPIRFLSPPEITCLDLGYGPTVEATSTRGKLS